jgi:hypothetical protein
MRHAWSEERLDHAAYQCASRELLRTLQIELFDDAHWATRPVVHTTIFDEALAVRFSD